MASSRKFDSFSFNLIATIAFCNIQQKLVSLSSETFECIISRQKPVLQILCVNLDFYYVRFSFSRKPGSIYFHLCTQRKSHQVGRTINNSSCFVVVWGKQKNTEPKMMRLQSFLVKRHHPQSRSDIAAAAAGYTLIKLQASRARRCCLPPIFGDKAFKNGVVQI